MPAPKARKPAARVEAIVARNAATAVIFRRGPTRHVRMLKWDLRNDKIEPGQWIEARVHVERCDLSPDGELVACFVASYRRTPGTWTAISRPPYFTALAVWPKGDTYGGGGLFVSDGHFLLEHDTLEQGRKAVPACRARATRYDARRGADACRRSQRHDVRGDRGAEAHDEVAIGVMAAGRFD